LITGFAGAATGGEAAAGEDAEAAEPGEPEIGPA
jgi:hypothetical protein